MNTKRIFYDFLQKHNALEAYKRSLETSIGRSDVRGYEHIPLGASFVWAHTPEGHEYWRLLDEKWCRHYDSMKKKISLLKLNSYENERSKPTTEGILRRIAN